MKFKYRIVQDANGEYQIQYRRKGFLSFMDNWHKKFLYDGWNTETLGNARVALTHVMAEDQKECNREILKVIE